jgi:uncharacterized protein (DUF1778 family)
VIRLLKKPGVKLRMAKSKKNNNKAKLNLSVRDEQRNKLEQMASLENRSVSNLIEVMADERWERLAEQQGVAYAKTVAEAMKLKLDADNSSRPREIAPGSSRSCRREKNAKAKRAWLKFCRSLSDKQQQLGWSDLPLRAFRRRQLYSRHSLAAGL